MQKITLELHEAERFALELITPDPAEWAENLLTNRARIALLSRKGSAQWVQAAMAVMQDQGDPNDDWAVLLKAKELQLFPTAAEQSAVIEQDMAE